MSFEIVDILSLASGNENEDRAGVAPPFAWVIDGATDVVPEPLTHAPSDAAWFAAAMNETLHEMATAPPQSLVDVPRLVAERLAPRFTAETRRVAAGPEEHPSAAAIIVRATGRSEIEYVSLGDCTLLIEHGDGFTQIGVDEETAGDRWVAEALTGRETDGEPQQAPLTRADLWPRLRAQRARMNAPSGYGIFSITPPPGAMIRHGTLPVSPGARILLASDGLLRLVDVFRQYDTSRLFAAAWSGGLAPLFSELRALEADDAECTRFPRAKTSDDTTAVLLRVTAP
ncbi:protein phosphatase 2C domain-containing protein [Hyphomicrobium sp.]|uniref:protein phosphatase 2C domain-containing protein n=1 Tax=Hyphomicrobium sp. TaxID=82 RepID=UPI0025BB2BED|nr:protein phosphatase 2C domain-containing protein [Hyphomicrobium sp.]MCC7252552.1 protein phosphatase 2C domain-containing protein [Hyphomicrobium sp.]